MPKTVWKYELEITDEQTLRVPRGAVVRSVGKQGDKLCLWAEVDPERWANADTAKLGVQIVGTGNPFPGGHIGRFVGTVVTDPFEWHVYAG